MGVCACMELLSAPRVIAVQFRTVRIVGIRAARVVGAGLHRAVLQGIHVRITFKLSRCGCCPGELRVGSDRQCQGGNKCSANQQPRGHGLPDLATRAMIHGEQLYLAPPRAVRVTPTLRHSGARKKGDRKRFIAGHGTGVLGSPKMPNETPAARRWAAIDRPQGPAWQRRSW